MNVVKWSCTLGGHVVLWELVFSLPLFLSSLSYNYSAGQLTFGRLIWIFSVWAVLGIVAAVCFWYTVTYPMIKNRRGKR